MNTLELRIPPVVVFAAVALLMRLASWGLPAWHFTVPGRVFIAFAIAFAGWMVGLAGVMAFRHARTTVHPLKPSAATALVTSGIYTWSRNPMYLGLLLVLLAWGLFLAHPVSLLLIPGFVLYMNRFQIIPEERVLAASFGADFEAYRTQVRRWV